MRVGYEWRDPTEEEDKKIEEILSTILTEEDKRELVMIFLST